VEKTVSAAFFENASRLSALPAKEKVVNLTALNC
jgi:hypothetical protein